MVTVETSPEIVRLGEDGCGQERFTTRETIGVEERMERATGALSQAKGHTESNSARTRDEALGRSETAGIDRDSPK